MSMHDYGPRSGRVYVENTTPCLMSLPEEDLPEGCAVVAETIVTWGTREEFHIGHRLELSTPAGPRTYLSLASRGDLGEARALSFQAHRAAFRS